jgi:hypothetical protein
MYILGGVLWMVPAGFAISAFSMVMFFLQKYEYPKLRTAMAECAKKMIGNRLAMFSYKLIFYLVYGMLFVVAGACLMLVYMLLAESLLISWIVSMCGAIVFIFLYTMVTVYFHSSNQIFFEDVLSRDEKKRQRKIQSEANSTALVGEEKVEDSKNKDNATKKETKKVAKTKSTKPKKTEKKTAEPKKKKESK